MAADRKVVLVKRQTRYEELLAQYNTESQAAFVIESRGDSFQDYKEEHFTYQDSLEAACKAIKAQCRLQVIDRSFLPNFVFGKDDIIMVIGQDGLVANTVKYLSGQAVIAVNPDRTRFDGILLPFGVTDVEPILTDVRRDHFQVKTITMAEARMNDGQRLLAVNDLFIGPQQQTSAWYEITLQNSSEFQSSSGVIVSTGLGSTGWLKSIFAGASGVVGSHSNQDASFGWDADYLRYVVREPFPSKATGTSIVYGDIAKGTTMTLTSKMGQGGVIFSDGMLDDFLDFNSGAIASIGTAKEQGNLVC
ncbi:MAG: hypothetical protein R3208_15595 [Ketobacteraceae bacterium]|nr:hypothetical protein [Ketobacteraceae bacterium]